MSLVRGSRKALAFLVVGGTMVYGAMFGQASSVQAGPKLNSAVNVEVKEQGPEARSLTFTVKPLPGLVVNEDGPWALEIQKAEGLTPAKTKLSKADYLAAVPGFKLDATAAKGANSPVLSYRLVAFVCTQDKKQCFRDVHMGQYPEAAK